MIDIKLNQNKISKFLKNFKDYNFELVETDTYIKKYSVFGGNIEFIISKIKGDYVFIVQGTNIKGLSDGINKHMIEVLNSFYSSDYTITRYIGEKIFKDKILLLEEV